MKNFINKRVETYCAFCKTPRKMERKKRIGFADILACALGSLVLMGFVFQDWDASAVLFFIAFLAVAEMFIQLRWRMGVVCKSCGFDPVLYVKSPDQAATRVNAFLLAKKDDPMSLLTAPLVLPKRKRPPPPPEKGKRLSKQI